MSNPEVCKRLKFGEFVGVDLDGTLAEHHGWVPPGQIGAPIPLMVDRVKLWLSQGVDVRIFTARACDGGLPEGKEYVRIATAAIREWCLEHIGQELPITCTKDWRMVEFWDDRAIQVIENTGQCVADLVSRA